MSNQVIILSNDSNPNPLWLDEDLNLAIRFKRNSEYLIENSFGTKLVKLCSPQDLIICNGIIKWSISNQMTCIHGIGSSIIDYVIYDILLSNQNINFDLLNNHDPDSNHRPLSLTLNFVMHNKHMHENCESQIH